MDQGQLNWIANFIWGIADDVLRDVYVRGKYRDVILPMVVIRRLDAVLEPTKSAVLQMKANLDKAKVANQEAALRKASGQAFYNASPFTLRELKNRGKASQLKADFEAYLDGFSDNVKEILAKFEFHNQIPRLHTHDLIGALIEKFLDRSINLSPFPVKNDDGSVKIPALDNHAMGTVFEELIRRFNEENNEEAGEHFTPRDVVALMADLIFMPIATQIKDATYTVYDGACGTGGMLTVAEDRLRAIAKENGKSVEIHLYGQEVNAETYAITKADLLLKGEGQEAENFRHGSTLSNDGFPGMEFNFMLSNPPYGKSWKTDLEKMGGKDGIKDPRFIIDHAGDPEYSLLTRSSDGQLLFLVNKLVKMKADFDKYPFGSRIAEVHNGSALFTGDAGQGESNIRRWIIENDWLEAIIALPLNMFYNTGIATYIWVLTNKKPKHRRGKVQLIDATAWSKPLRKNLGKKNCELSVGDIAKIMGVFMDFKDTPESKIFPNEAFGYVRPDQYGRIMRRGLPKLGDLLFTTEAPLGHVALVDREDVALAQRIIRFRLDEQVLRPRFALVAMLSQYFQTQLELRATGSTASGIKASKLPQLQIVKPPTVGEQDAIVGYVDRRTADINHAISDASREIDLIREYRTRLVADVVTGKVDVRGVSLPNEEREDVVTDAEIDGQDESGDDETEQSLTPDAEEAEV